MKSSLIVLFAFTGIYFSCAQMEKSEIKETIIDNNEQDADENMPVLVELFTSQGCSSCPPADKVLESINENYGKKEVIAISFHVDYWNYLGWDDTFSDSKHSKRQRWYNRLLKDGTYTPQMIINGNHSLVGSRKSEVNDLVKSELKRTTKNRVKIQSTVEKSQNKIKINFNASGMNKEDFIQVALVEKESVVKIARGENGGRNIKYNNIVRQFKKIDSAKGNLEWNTEGISDYFILIIAQNSNAELLALYQINLKISQ